MKPDLPLPSPSALIKLTPTFMHRYESRQQGPQNRYQRTGEHKIRSCGGGGLPSILHMFLGKPAVKEGKFNHQLVLLINQSPLLSCVMFLPKQEFPQCCVSPAHVTVCVWRTPPAARNQMKAHTWSTVSLLSQPSPWTCVALRGSFHHHTANTAYTAATVRAHRNSSLLSPSLGSSVLLLLLPPPKKKR